MADRSDDGRGLSSLEDELRVVHTRIDQAKSRMRQAIDVFGLLGFGLAFVGLIVVAGLAAVSFASDETGVGMLFSALTVVALPIVAIAAWHAFGRLWSLSRELSVLRRKEATIFSQLESVGGPAPAPDLDDTRIDAGPPSGLGGFMGGLGRGPRRVSLQEPPPGNTADGYREITDRNRGIFGRAASLWLLVGVGILFLIFVIGVALGSASTG
ncbi:hypothetical protein [Cryptosporangium aurantiacum]|uniref:Uncharacterized protein n=1 Tax=Cryptosporangium aurantiacum TaxID=134849 RepID=A0A1M7HFW3_9ACTN|nr:hypothetical protein [Cryptosporangium aurantiacum]SHM27037.1 hypothetical protein SAMN05443668_101168 [Cryptosporangium aurantiacum]